MRIIIIIAIIVFLITGVAIAKLGTDMGMSTGSGSATVGPQPATGDKLLLVNGSDGFLLVNGTDSLLIN